MRYYKQEHIEGWGQCFLEESSIAVVGSSNLASFISTDLIAMGFGNITKIGENTLSFVDLKKMSSEIRFREMPGEILSSKMAEVYIKKPDYIIEASSPSQVKQKIICFEYAQKNSIPLISAMCSDKSYSIKYYPAEELQKADCLKDILNFHNDELSLEAILDICGDSSLEDVIEALETSQEKGGCVNSVVAAGLVTDELRKRIMPLKDERQFNEISGKYCDKKINKRVLLVGAGAIGTFAGICLAVNGAHVDILDFDKVELTNLNRQVLFYDSVDRYKSEAMVEKLSAVNSHLKAIVGKVNTKYKFDKSAYDIILGCVDNLKARYCLDTIAYKSGVPLVNTGTELFAGSVMPYIKNITACIDCQTFKKISSSKNETANNDESCYEPAIITSNQIIGGLAVAKIAEIFNIGACDNIGVFKYDSNIGIRRGNALEKCLEDCEKNGKQRKKTCKQD